MARIRNIKPEFFASETVSALPLRARLTWIGLWTHCDNHGRARDNAKLIKGAVWPLDNVSLKEIEEDLETLAEAGRIVRYEVAGKRYLVITNWGEHQYGAFKGAPKFPAPEDGLCLNPDGSRTVLDEFGRTTGDNPVDNSSIADRNTAPPAEQEKSSDLLDESGPGLEKSPGIQVSGVRGQGGGTRETRAKPDDRDRPPERCARHVNHPDPPPCGRCADARREAEAWDVDATERRQAILRAIEGAMADPRQRCEHGVDGGKFIHPATGVSARCAHCRRAAKAPVSAARNSP